MASSRATMMTTIHAGIQFRPTNAMKAEQTMILSAKRVHQDAEVGDQLAAPRNLAVQKVADPAGDE